MSHAQHMTDQLSELTSLCQSHDEQNTGTLDKTLVRHNIIIVIKGTGSLFLWTLFLQPSNSNPDFNLNS